MAYKVTVEHVISKGVATFRFTNYPTAKRFVDSIEISAIEDGKLIQYPTIHEMNIGDFSGPIEKIKIIPL